MRRKLAEAEDHLRSLVESKEASDEEYQSANEEILSANEELQSTNEELETSKEELQSANEELNTVNDELHNRNVEKGPGSDSLACESDCANWEDTWKSNLTQTAP